METFAESRSRNAVIKRMIEIGLIADRSEILPSKRKRAAKSGGARESDEESAPESDASDVPQTRPVKITKKKVKAKTPKEKPNGSVRAMPQKTRLDATGIRQILSELGEEFKENFEWIQESLTDAAEDAEDPSDDPDDGVPLVPFSAAQREAFDSETFKRLLVALGFQEPLKDMVRNPRRNPFDIELNSFRFVRKPTGGSRST